MSHKCKISGKSHIVGNRVSHANNKTSHTFYGNIQSKRIFDPETKKFYRLKLSTRIIRTIDKLGLKETLKKHGLTLDQVTA